MKTPPRKKARKGVTKKGGHNVPGFRAENPAGKWPD
jgi:hypothetical protein